MRFDGRPVLVFWETTRACALSCLHCRASAITEPLPGELSTEEGMAVIDQVAAFGRPYPTIIFTGGDPLRRRDLFTLLRHAADRGIGYAVSPAATPEADGAALRRLLAGGASSISISLDGASPETHDSIRGREGTFERTLGMIREAVETGLRPQVNTVVMKRNFRELPRIFHLLRSIGVTTWEVFFLVRVGRGRTVEEVSPEEGEAVCDLLYDASFYGATIRCVEAPFIRRVVAEEGGRCRRSPAGIHAELRTELLRLEGAPTRPRSSIRPTGTLDGDGTVFVAHDGTINPGGLIPVNLGNTRGDDLVEVYRGDPLLRRIRAREFVGPCGECEYSEVCGGSRARAFANDGNPLSSDPACLLVSGRQ